MRRRSVLVLFHHQLFGEAIARALAADPRLQVTSLALPSVSRPTLDQLRPDALVIEGPLCGGADKTALLGAPPVLTIVVGPETNIAEVYERREVIHATAAEIGARIVAATARRGVSRRSGT